MAVEQRGERPPVEQGHRQQSHRVEGEAKEIQIEVLQHQGARVDSDRQEKKFENVLKERPKKYRYKFCSTREHEWTVTSKRRRSWRTP